MKRLEKLGIDIGRTVLLQLLCWIPLWVCDGLAESGIVTDLDDLGWMISVFISAFVLVGADVLSRRRPGREIRILPMAIVWMPIGAGITFLFGVLIAYELWIIPNPSGPFFSGNWLNGIEYLFGGAGIAVIPEVVFLLYCFFRWIQKTIAR